MSQKNAEFSNAFTDGFRKVVALENGMMTSAKNSAIEFQHPFFKREKFSLLANIKRKVASSPPPPGCTPMRISCVQWECCEGSCCLFSGDQVHLSSSSWAGV